MNNLKKICTDQRFITVLSILSIIMIAFLIYKDMLDYFFRVEDELACIYKGRLRSQGDILRIFTESFLEGTHFSYLRFYRPMVILSCGIDYSIWGLNPFGYYLTNLIIHMLASIFIFFLVRKLTGGKKFIPWLSAVVFTAHPGNLYSVSYIAARCDTLAALFMILSLLLFLRHLMAGSFRRLFLLSSVFSYMLAFFSKETAVILPILIFTYLIIFSDGASPKIRTIHAIKKAVPYFIVTFAMIVWRAYVLKEIKGGFGFPEGFQNIVFNYFHYLLDLNDFTLFNLDALYTPIAQFFITPLVFLLIFLMLCKRIIGGRKENGTIKILLVTGFILSVAAIIVRWKNNLPGRDGVLINRLHLSALFFLSCLTGIVSYGKCISSPSPYKDKLTAFLLSWLLLPLGLYLFTGYMAGWYMYNPSIPFSILLSLIVIKSLKSFEGLSLSSRSVMLKRIAVPLVMSALILFLFINSPAAKIKGWKPDVKTASMFLDKFLEVVPELPDGATIFLYNIPQNILAISDHGIKIWLDMVYPGNKVNAIFSTQSPPAKTIPDHLDFKIQIVENKKVLIDIITGANSKK